MVGCWYNLLAFVTIFNGRLNGIGEGCRGSTQFFLQQSAFHQNEPTWSMSLYWVVLMEFRKMDRDWEFYKLVQGIWKHGQILQSLWFSIKIHGKWFKTKKRAGLRLSFLSWGWKNATPTKLLKYARGVLSIVEKVNFCSNKNLRW